MTRKKNEIDQATPVSQDEMLAEGGIPVAAEGESPAVTETIDTAGAHDGTGNLIDGDDKPLLLSDAEGTGLLEASSEESGDRTTSQEEDGANPPADTVHAENSVTEEQAEDAGQTGILGNPEEDPTAETGDENPPQKDGGADPPADAAPTEDPEMEKHAAVDEQNGDDKQPEDGERPSITSEIVDDKNDSVATSDKQADGDAPTPRRRTTRKKQTEEISKDTGDSNAPAVDSPKPTRKKRASPKADEAPAPAVRRPSTGVLTIESRAEVETPEDKEELVWHEMQNALRTRRILSGILGGIESTENHNIIAVIYYKDLRVVIPVSEMMIQLSTEPNNYGEMAERQNKILNNMLGCEVDFVVKGIDARTRSVVASRREAMLRKRKTFYLQPDLNGQSQIHEGRVVQARVIAVATKVVRVEVFGVETSILARDLSWEWIGDAHERYTVGDEILIRIRKVNLESPEQISIEADVRSVTENTVQANLKKCKVQGKYAGTVTDIHKGVVFVRLAIGVNAIAHACYDNRMPAKSDDVSFAVTHIDEDRGVAVGIITRIIKQRI